MRLLIGIDPGVQTGFAVWNLDDQRFVMIRSLTILEAIQGVTALNDGEEIEVWVEDARLRKYFGRSGRERLQGAGSIKRDCKIWEDFLERAGIKYKMIPPKANKTKLNAASFKKWTMYQGQTNEHGRDAAMLVYGVKTFQWSK